MIMLDALEFGVPQRRLRSVLLAIRGDKRGGRGKKTTHACYGDFAGNTGSGHAPYAGKWSVTRLPICLR